VRVMRATSPSQINNAVVPPHPIPEMQNNYRSKLKSTKLL